MSNRAGPPAAALDAEDGTLLEAARSIRWPARRRAPWGAYGGHASRVSGRSQEFAEYRAYRQGDATRRIDWKVLARTDRAYVRVSEERVAMPTLLLVDGSASLAYPRDTLDKWRCARCVAIGLAGAAHGGGDPVGLWVASSAAGGRLRRVPPRSRRSVLQDIATTLSNVTPAGTAGLAPMLARLRGAWRIVIISDFLEDEENLLATAGALGPGMDVYAVHVVHETELNPPRGSMLLIDPERPHLRRPLTDGTRQRYIERFAAWCESLGRRWAMQGALYTRVVTSEPPALAVRRIAADRAGLA